MKIVHPRQGFTLVELLIASSISLVVMLTIVSAFRTGIFGYRDIEDALATDRGAGQILGRLRLDLKNAISYTKDQSGFTGEENAMSFLTVADVFEDRVWRKEFSFVTYRWDGKSLTRTWKPGRAALNSLSQAIPQSVAIPVGKVVLLYGKWNKANDQLVFADRWDPMQGVPAAIKIDLIYNNVPFEQFVALPVTKWQ